MCGTVDEWYSYLKLSKYYAPVPAYLCLALLPIHKRSPILPALAYMTWYDLGAFSKTMLFYLR